MIRFNKIPIFLLILTACGPNSPSSPRGSSPEGSAQDSPALIYATGWSEISLIANWAKTSIDHVAHFQTSRNACGKEEAGALEIEVWNALAVSANAVAKSQPLPESQEYCLQVTTDPWKMDGVVEILLDGGKRPLFDARGDQICTTIQDKTIARDLLEAINKVVITADKEGCPNGWGSGLVSST